MNNVWQRVWKLQGELNAMIGIDTRKLGQDVMNHTGHNTWLYRYLDECVNEAVECKENFYHKWWCKEVQTGAQKLYSPVDEAKIKLELIDVLHFCISAMHIAYPNGEGVHFDSIPMLIPCTWKDAYEGLNKLIQFCLLRLPDHVFYELRALMDFMDINEEEILRIYEMKWQANVKRQEQGYSVAEKTEEDNIGIEETLR